MRAISGYSAKNLAGDFRSKILFFILLLGFNFLMKHIASGITDETISLIFGMVTKLVMVLAVIWVILYGHGGLFARGSGLQRIFVWIIAGTIIYLSILFMKNNVEPSVFASSLNWLYLLFCILTAASEELLCRDFVFRNVYKSNGKLISSILITSLIFGLAHAGNFFHEGAIALSVVNQIWFAFVIGILFQALYLRFQGISLVIAIHAAVNYMGGYRRYLIDAPTTEAVEPYDFWGTFLFILFFFLLTAPVAWVLIQKKLRSSL